MLELFCIFLFLWGCSQCCSVDRYKRSDYGKERRHREMLEQRKSHAKENPRKNKRVNRTYARDEQGRFVAKKKVEKV